MKIKTPEFPLWLLLVCSQLLDMVFLPFSLASVESIEAIGDGGYGKVMIYECYTHSFVGGLCLPIIAADLAGIFWSKKIAGI
ncbi:hypothetical protein [Saliterribacillus persicus]|uniref:hypothetical protein n=1 Tax=Saliterribacillus persicus TaxID=930114 RepID=UPI000DF1E963|nr:hypothetical protein [Saliterribacillus persicus]